MVNSVVLVGRLTRDPELRKTQSGKSVAGFTLAIDNLGKDAGASFFDVSLWGDSADNLVKYTHKGSLVGVVGRLLQRTYTAKDGRKVEKVEVVANSVQFLDSKPKTDDTNTGNAKPAPSVSAPVGTSHTSNSPANAPFSLDDIDADMPF